MLIPIAADETFVAQLDHRADLVVELCVRTRRREHPQVHDIECRELERPQVVLDARPQLGRGAGGSQPPCSSRRGPTLLTMTSSGGYGWSAVWISSFATSGP